MFFTYINLSKDWSVKYYENNQERLQQNARGRYQNLFKG